MDKAVSPSGQMMVQTLLSGISLQLRSLRDDGYLIENTVGHIIGSGYPEKSELATSLQKLDQMVQSLEGIADFVDQLSDLVDPDLKLDPTYALCCIKQRDLADALAGGSRRVTQASGDADFF